jgi:DNA polymerase-3 subunit alpha
MLGLYISGHPLSKYQKEISAKVTLFSSDLTVQDAESVEDAPAAEYKNINDGSPVSVAGIITAKKTKTTKSNRLMAFITLEDLYGSMEVIVFPAVLSKYAGAIAEDNIVLIKGKVSIKEEEAPKIICEEVQPLMDGSDEENKSVKEPTEVYESKTDMKNVKELQLIIKNSLRTRDLIFSLDALLRYFSGRTSVTLLDDDMKPIKVKRGEYRVNINDSLISELNEKLGEENVRLRH